MELNEAEYLQEETPVDALLLVRGINKYLKKALKKIEAIQKASYRHEGEVDPIPPEESISENLDGRQEDMRTPNEASSPVNPKGQVILESQETLSQPSQSFKEPRKVKSLNLLRELPIDNNKSSSLKEPIIENNVARSDICTDIGKHEVANREDSVNSDCDDDDYPLCSQASVPTPIKLFDCCSGSINVKSEDSTVFYPLPLFFKAFLSNLPLTVNVSKLKTWLESKCVSSYEDITIYTKQSFKTSIVSYYDKGARDRLLLLDGNMIENKVVKIRRFVDKFSADSDEKDGKKNTQK